MTIEFKIIPAYQATRSVELNAATTLGIEVTVPAVAEKCGLGNIDHHGEGCTSDTPSACEQVFVSLFGWKYSCHGEERGVHQNRQLLDTCKTVVGNVLDSDTLAAMALYKIANEEMYYHDLYEFEMLVHMLGSVDRLGAASAVDDDGNKYAEHSLVKAIIAVSGSRTMGIDQQINEVVQILTIQEVSEEASKAVEESDKLFAAAKEASKVTALNNGIILVESSHHAATRIGYEHGDVLVCLNEKMMKDFKNKDAGTYKKFTVCKRDENVQAIINFDRLNDLEEANGTWGGRSTVGGSPQGVDSTLTVEQVENCIEFKQG